MSGNQPELKGMPPKTKSTLKAEEVVAAMEILEDKKSVLENRRDALVSQLKADNETKVVCLSAAGIKFRFNIRELEKLEVKKDK